MVVFSSPPVSLEVTLAVGLAEWGDDAHGFAFPRSPPPKALSFQDVSQSYGDS